MPTLKDRLLAFNLNESFPYHSAMESEITEEQQKEKKGKYITENAAEPVAAKHAVRRKKPTKKASAPVSDGEEDTLKDRLVAFNLNDSFPYHSAMESEITEEQQKGKKGRKVPSKRGVTNKALSSLGVLPDEVQDDNFSMEEPSEWQNEKEADMGQLPHDQPECPPTGRPKRSRKPTWKVQDQMEVKGAAQPRNAIAEHVAHKNFPLTLPTTTIGYTGRQACPINTALKNNNKLRECCCPVELLRVLKLAL